jgi:hypothetical protein
MKTLARTLAVRLVFSLLLAVPVPSLAQTSALSNGEEVRVRWVLRSDQTYGFPVHRSVVGEVIDQGPGHIMVKRKGQFVTVPLGRLTSVERRIGTKPASAPAMVLGSGIGFAAGFLAGVVAGSLDRTAEEGDTFDNGLVTGVLFGAPIGALVVYAASRSRGIYEAVDMASALPAVAIKPTGRVGLSMRVATR